jgi:hypothetical protein
MVSLQLLLIDVLNLTELLLVTIKVTCYVAELLLRYIFAFTNEG